MASVDSLLAALADAARRNAKTEFDRLELELFSLFHGGFEGMPEDVYQRYLDVDRHWPIAVEPARPPGADAPLRRRTLLVRLAEVEDLWVKEMAAETDRSPSAVVSECIEAIRRDADRIQDVRTRLEQGRGRQED